MKISYCIRIAVLVIFSIAASAQTATVFDLNPMHLSNNWLVKGTITTDGTVGPLTPANILDWNLTVVQTTTFTWTERDSNDLNISGVTSDGKRIYVATSPDGFQDGGVLSFARGGFGGSIQTTAIIADFTQLGTYLGYVGGIAGWQDEIWGLNYVGLNQRDGTQYRAALAFAGRPNVFRINVPTIASSPLLMDMSGTITTDGTIGPLLPQNIVAWKITARNQDIAYYTNLNSTVRAASGVSSDGTSIKVDHAGGQFIIGFGTFRPTFVTIADFTDPAFRNGFKNYYMGNYGVMGERFPLTRATTYVVATR